MGLWLIKGHEDFFSHDQRKYPNTAPWNPWCSDIWRTCYGWLLWVDPHWRAPLIPILSQCCHFQSIFYVSVLCIVFFSLLYFTFIDLRIYILFACSHFSFSTIVMHEVQWVSWQSLHGCFYFKFTVKNLLLHWIGSHQQNGIPVPGFLRFSMVFKFLGTWKPENPKTCAMVQGISLFIKVTTNKTTYNVD